MTAKSPANFSILQCMETLCLIFSVINACTWILAFLSSLGVLLFLLYLCIYNWWHGSKSDPKNEGEGWAYAIQLLTTMSVVATLLTGLTLYFAIILLIGVKNNNKRYIKTYLVYGITLAITSVLGILGKILLKYEGMQIPENDLIIIGILFVYTGILLLIYKTYIASDRRQLPNDRLLNPSNVPQSYGSH